MDASATIPVQNPGRFVGASPGPSWLGSFRRHATTVAPAGAGELPSPAVGLAPPALKRSLPIAGITS
jgi:hypothetical protein